MNKPILLQKQELIKPIEQALSRVEEIRQRKAQNNDSIILEGLFALAVSSFENSINDTLRILLINIPEKLDLKGEQISKEQLIDGNPLKHAIDLKINAVSYKSLPDILKYFIKITDIRENVITEEELNSLIEIKATRNLLIHNNLIINSFYRETAGTNAREASGFENRLRISQDYLFESLTVMRNILENFKTELLEKYATFTRVNAIKKLFAYIFKTPIMVFENEFEVDIERDVISFIKPETSRRNGLSSSERLYFNIWVAHSHGDTFEFSSGEFFKLGNRDKMAFFLNNIDILKS